MPRKSHKEQVPCDYFNWLLGSRNGVYFADGRGNKPPLGRHSLGTRDRAEALGNLRRLDLVKAVELGQAEAKLLKADAQSLLTLDEGRRLYLEHAARPAVQGGTAPATIKRYRTVLEKFIAFSAGVKVRYWQQVDEGVLSRYGGWLEENDYHDKTQYIELTVLKQVLKWLVARKLLPPGSAVALKLQKPAGTSTHCYTRAQVGAILAHCRATPGLAWLGDVVLALATTGLRIGELSDLRWSDLDLTRGLLTLRDTTRRSRRSARGDMRATKSHRDRSLPIYKDLLEVLKHLPRHADGRVFHGPHGGRLKPDTVRNVLQREVLEPLTKRFPATGDDPGIAAGRLHSFRHYFCSIAADNGVSEQMLMAWLGHRNSAMVKHYYHLRQDESRRLMDGIDFIDGPEAESSGAA
jgi:integrase